MVKKILIMFILIFCLTGCNSVDVDDSDMEELLNSNKVRITLNNQKTMDIELYPDKAPITVANFLKLVDAKFYDGVCFHRIIKDFMAQTGGYYLNGNQLLEKEDVPTIKGEFTANGVENDIKHVEGVISMARAKPNDSASGQFFICTGTSPHLDGAYAAFGKVFGEESFETLRELNETKTMNIGYGFTDFPVEEVKIISIIRIK